MHFMVYVILLNNFSLINCYKKKYPSIILTCRAPAKNGPTAAPIDPVPSIMEVTVARAFPEPRKLGCVPSSAETAVVINAYGPFTRRPTARRSIIFPT